MFNDDGRNKSRISPEIDAMMAADSVDLNGAYAAESSSLLRGIVPGQIAWDQARTAYAGGYYIDSALFTVKMVGEQILTVSGFRGIQAGFSIGWEYRFSRNFRVAPFGNRTGNRLGEIPHYHRRGRPMNGQTPPGQGIGRHRPSQSSPHDKSFWDRF